MIQSKLPNVGTSIFSVMSKMANDYEALNLSQGFPEFDVDPQLIDLVSSYMKKGANQYAPMPGLPKLREAIAKKINRLYGTDINADTHVTVTAGASEGIFSTIQSLVSEGDEVIFFEPGYDLYRPAIELAGGKAVPIKLNSDDFSIPWGMVKRQISSKTKLIIINSPHNPSGSILSTKDLQQLKEIIIKNSIYLLSDEVYEHIIFNAEHLTPLAIPEIKDKCIAAYSFGKTFHATGWKVGYVVASEELTKEIRKVHQYNSFAIHTPTQHAIADFLEDSKNYEGIGELYQEKKSFFEKSIQGSRFKIIPSFGTYFQCLSFAGFSDESDVDFANRLTKEKGLASIPISAFYSDGFDPKILRFCFAKNEDTLKKAADILCKI